MLKVREGRWNSSSWYEVWGTLVDTFDETPNSPTATIYREFKDETGLNPRTFLELPV